LYVCEQHTNDTFKLKNNLRTKEIRLIDFKKHFIKYIVLKKNIESTLSRITSDLENIMPNQKIDYNNVRMHNKYNFCLFIYSYISLGNSIRATIYRRINKKLFYSFK
jgi:hypothetical protein